MGNGIKGRTQVEKDENGEKSRVCSHEEVIGYLHKSCFCTMKWTETRLELFVKTIEREVIVNLGCNYLFENFGNEGEIGDRTKIIEVAGVSTGFLRIAATAADLSEDGTVPEMREE